jgi:hypothetical protein
MTKKPFDPQNILSHEQVRIFRKGLEGLLGPEVLQMMKGYRLDMERSIRFMAVSSRTKARREALGLTLKQAAGILKVPQYRLKAIEEGRQQEILPEVLEAYLRLLGLKPWFGQWRKANPQVKFSHQKKEKPLKRAD